MREREQPNHALPVEIYDVIRKSIHRVPAGWDIIRHARDDLADLWPTGNAIQRGIDGFNKLETKSIPLAVVLNSSVFEFGRSFGFRTERSIHRSVSRRTTRARTSSHGSPADSPLMTRRARRSISRAHAASTCAGSWASVSSRLASNSAAMSARSGVGRLRASRKSSCARDVTGPLYIGL